MHKSHFVVVFYLVNSDFNPMKTLIILATGLTSDPNYRFYSFLGTVLIIAIMVFWDLIPTEANIRRWKLAQFQKDYSEIFGVDKCKAVVRWLDDCSAIVKRSDKEFVRIFKNAQGLFTEEPYPVFAGQEEGTKKA